VGVCFAAAVLAAKAGCSLALGAFLAGVLASASGRVPKIEHLVLPLRDLFGAIFFVAVGMLLEPRSLAAQAGPILVLTTVILVGDTLGATLGGALAGLPLRVGFRTGLALAQPGEFSFVLVGVGVSAGLLAPDLMAVPVGACILTALLGPVLFRHGDALAAGLERRLPARLNWHLKTYQTWAAKLGRSSLGRGPAPLRKPLVYLVLDAALINAVIIGAALLKQHLPWFRTPRAALGLLVGQGALLMILGRALCGRALEIAERILATGRGAPPVAGRRHLLASLSLALLLLVGAPSLAVLEPFLPQGPMFLVYLGGLAGLLGLLWLRSRRFPPEGALGSEWLLDRVQAPWAQAAPPPAHPGGPEVLSLRLGPQCPYLGRPVGELPLQALTGATVLGLMRRGEPLTLTGEQQFQAEDLLALCGSPAALQAAARLLGCAER
jgi:CPA2 family monovalent cation:H+ antiporter-2